jgi:iron complex outermembrane recepter protein
VNLAVTRGQVVSRDFNLKSSMPVDAGRNVVTLDRFRVAAAREGTAKAIMEQRSAMTVKNVVATDTFGAIVEGNVGDVLQYVPGMQIIYPKRRS